MAPERIRVARVGAAHGIRGEVRLFVDADDPLTVKDLGPLEDATGKRNFRIVAQRAAKDHLIVRFDGIDDRNAAEALTHLELYVAREKLPPTADANTFYQADLVGLRAETADGTSLGIISGVQNFGAGDLLEISPADGGETILVPFVDRFVPMVDVAGGRVVVDPPEEIS